MVKILFMIHDLGQGGAEKVLVNLVNNMDRSKFDITVVSLFGGGVNEQFLKKDIHYYSVFPKSVPGNSILMKLLTPTQLHKICVKDEYDIEVSYLEGPVARIISGCASKHTKLVSWIHVEQHTKKIAAKAFRTYNESVQCYKRFHHTICVSESVKEDFWNLYPILQEPMVLYNTNETDQILELKEKPVAEGIFKEGEFRLCGVGKLMSNKGFDKLARIHRRLVEEGYPIHTYLLGSGPEEGSLRNFVEESQMTDSFTFLGYQTNPYCFVAKCDVFVCTSISEGFSTAATEALVVGTPVVTTPVAGMSEMLGKNNEYGIITEQSEESLYQALHRLIIEPQLLKHYREQARKRGKKFSKEKTVAAVEQMLLSMGE